MLDVGIIGTGAIGTSLAEKLSGGAIEDARVTAVYNRTPERAADLVDSLDAGAPIHVAADPSSVAERADVVVEAASQRAIEQSAVDILESGATLFVLSVGAFRNERLLGRVRRAAKEHDTRVRVPSASIAGLDGVAAVATEPVEELTLVHYRAPSYLDPYLDDGTTPDEFDDGDVLFEGVASDAAAAFPSHMNIAIALTLAAGVPPEDVLVRVVRDDDASRSRNVIRARSTAGAIELEIENFRATAHDTSALIVGSVLAALRGETDRVLVRT
jgi:aspartate dehydrogenase